MTVTIAVVPGEAKSRYPELLNALEEAYPVRFVAQGGKDGVCDVEAVVVLEGGRVPERLNVPCLVLESPSQEQRPQSFAVEMSRSAHLDRALVGQSLTEHASARPAEVEVAPGHDVLASVAGKPVWTCFVSEGGVFREKASASLSELADRDYLRDHLTAGRFWSLLPLVQFVKRLTFGHGRRARPHAACLVIDDPNVRLASYGYVRFAQLGRDAREHGYHVAVATIPLDLLLPGRRGLRAFREYRTQLSLVVHGNDHVRRELERCRAGREADRIVRTAEARVQRFEKGVDVRIERVMCPPHGRCGPEVLAALFRSSYDGLAASRPFPWDAFAAHRDWRLGGWLPAQLVCGGLPVLPRLPLRASLDDLVFRAFLHQPLIVYCHHTDFREGLGSVHSAAARVAELGEVSWMSLGAIARTNAVISVDGAVTTVMTFSRDLRIPRPAADSLRIAIPRIFGGGQATRLEVDGRRLDADFDGSRENFVAVPDRPGGGELRIRLEARSSQATVGMRDWLPQAWPLARRAMTEARDRALPHVRRPTT
jgi:hypothetical protein